MKPKEHKLQEFEDKMLRTIFGPKEYEVGEMIYPGCYILRILWVLPPQQTYC
jgi:hypothetical protein